MFNNPTTSASDGNTVDATLLVTATTTTTTTNFLGGKRLHHWRRLRIVLNVSIAFNRTNILQSPTPSSSQADSTSLLQEAPNTENPDPENGVFKLGSNPFNSLSRKSFKNTERASTSSYVPLQSSPANPDVIIDIGAEQSRLRDSIVHIVQKKDLNSLKEFGGVEKVAFIFGSHLENGRQHDVQDPPQILATGNPIQKKEFFYFVLKASNRSTIFLLLIAAVTSFATGFLEQGLKDGWHDGFATLVALFMLITSQSVANFRRARNREKLRMKKKKLQVEVVRRGEQRSISISDVEAGDIVLLNEGIQVPADGLVVNNYGLLLDDVQNPKIDPESNPFLMYGSKVKEGHGSMLVTSVRDNRKLCKMISLEIKDLENKTLLEGQLEKMDADTEKLSLCFCILIALAAVKHLVVVKHHGNDVDVPQPKGNGSATSVGVLMKMLEIMFLKPQGKTGILASALSVTFIAIQLGTPFMITISLSCWNEKVEINQAEPHNLSACPTMGIVTLFCIDATGGILCKDMEIDKFVIGEKDVKCDVDSKIHQTLTEALYRGIVASALVSEVTPTNNSLVSWAKSRWSLKEKFLKDGHVSIQSDRKMSSDLKGCGVLIKIKGDEEGKNHTHWSGAASTIVGMCSHYYDSTGSIHEIFNDERSKFEEMIKDMEDSGLCPIAFACRLTEVPEIKEDGLHLLALAGLKHSYLQIQSAIENLRNSGVRIILVSEDELPEAKDIGRELGIYREDDVALEGERIRNLPISDIIDEIDKMSVMGSCLSEDKLRLVQSLREKGDHVVAFLGGLFNSDIPALKQADVGISQKTKCTEMARESSDIVISANSAEGSLTSFLKFGRCAYRNIQMFTQLQMTVCISSLLINLVTTVLDESALTTIQLIWVNGVMCLLGGQMMVMELGSQKLIANRPGKRTQSLLTKGMWINIVIQVLCQSLVLLIFQFKGQFLPGLSQDIQKSMIFVSFTLCQIVNLFNTMGLTTEVPAAVFRNYKFLLALGICLAIEVLLTQFVKNLPGFERLNGEQLAACFLLAAVSWGLNFAVKFILVLQGWVSE